jgi:hypothetical protein
MTGHQRLTSLLGVDFSASRPFATVEAILEHIALAAGPIIDVEDRNYPVISAGPPGPSSLLSRTKSLPTLKTKFYQISMNVGAGECVADGLCLVAGLLAHWAVSLAVGGVAHLDLLLLLLQSATRSGRRTDDFPRHARGELGSSYAVGGDEGEIMLLSHFRQA